MFRLFVSVGGIIGAGVIFFMFTQPNYDQSKIIKAEIAQYDQALDKAAELQKLKDTLLSRLNAFREEDIDRLQKLLPDHVDNVRLILDLDNMAGTRGVVLSNVDVTASSQTNSEVTTLGGDTGRKYESIDLRFNTTGTYEQFLTFMSDLETSLRIVDLQSLTMAQSGTVTVPGRGPQPNYNFSLRLKTYWLK